MSMVERVARAICAKSFEDPSIYWGDDTIPEAVERKWKDYVDDARAAIAAMREPPSEMITAGTSAINCNMNSGDALDFWQATIDAILAEQQEAVHELG